LTGIDVKSNSRISTVVDISGAGPGTQRGSFPWRGRLRGSGRRCVMDCCDEYAECCDTDCC
jgi:hypothetical protein